MGGAVNWLISPIMAATGLLKKPKKQEPLVMPTPNRNMAAEAAAQNDILARRKGVAANALLGSQGQEAGTRGKTQLGQ